MEFIQFNLFNEKRLFYAMATVVYGDDNNQYSKMSNRNRRCRRLRNNRPQLAIVRQLNLMEKASRILLNGMNVQRNNVEKYVAGLTNLTALAMMLTLRVPKRHCALTTGEYAEELSFYNPQL